VANEAEGAPTPASYADLYFDGERSTTMQIFYYSMGGIFSLVVVTLVYKASDASGITRETFLSRLEGSSVPLRVLRAVVNVIAWIMFIVGTLGGWIWAVIVFLAESVNTQGNGKKHRAASVGARNDADKAELGQWDSWGDDAPPAVPTAKAAASSGGPAKKSFGKN
jgi:hypothetical protein